MKKNLMITATLCLLLAGCAQKTNPVSSETENISTTKNIKEFSGERIQALHPGDYILSIGQVCPVDHNFQKRYIKNTDLFDWYFFVNGSQSTEYPDFMCYDVLVDYCLKQSISSQYSSATNLWNSLGDHTWYVKVKNSSGNYVATCDVVEYFGVVVDNVISGPSSAVPLNQQIWYINTYTPQNTFFAYEWKVINTIGQTVCTVNTSQLSASQIPAVAYGNYIIKLTITIMATGDPIPSHGKTWIFTKGVTLSS